MSRVRWGAACALVVALAACGVPGVAGAAVGPVTNVAASVGAQDELGDHPVTVAWTAPPGSDPATTRYELFAGTSMGMPSRVQSVAPGAGTTTTLLGLEGLTYAISVVAIDATDGAAAPAANSAIISVPRTVYAFSAPRIVQGGRQVACGETAATACTVRSLRALRMVANVTPAHTRTGAVLASRVERSVRAPGTRALDQTFSVAWADGALATTAGALDTSIIRSAGTWCLRPRMADNPRLTTAPGARRCIRYRPPVSIAWAGDTTLGSSSYGLSPNSGRTVLAGVRATISAADLAIDNYEGTLSTTGGARCSGGALCFTFQAPPRYAAALGWAGFDVANQANNHALDYGSAARRQSVAALRGAGLGVVGLPGMIHYAQVQDTRVATLGFSHSAGTDSIRDLATTRALVREAAAHADLVVVVMHAGTEGAGSAHVPRGDETARGENRGNTRAFVHAAIDAGADVVFGSGPHVVRGIEQRAGKLAFYSTGNFSGWHNFALGGAGSQSGVVEVTLDDRGTFTAGQWHAVTIDRPGVPRLDRGGSIIRRVSSLSRSDFGAASPRISSPSGTIRLR